MSSRIKLIFGSFLLFLLLLATAVWLNFKRLEGDTAWMDRAHAAIHGLQKTYSDLKEVQANYLSFLLTHRSRFAQACRSGMENLQKEVLKAEKDVPDDILFGRQMGRLEALIDRRVQDIREGLKDAENGRSNLALSGLQEKGGKSGDQEIKALIDQMIGTQIWILKTRRSFEEINNRKDLFYLSGGGFGALVLLALAFFLVDRQLRARQKLLSSLRASEGKFRFLAEAAHDTFLILDEKGHIIDQSPGAQELFGRRPEELLGRPLSQVLELPGMGKDAPFNEVLSRTLGLRTLELTGHQKDGSTMPLEGSISEWMAQEGKYYAVVLRDITERKFFIKTLLANEHRLFQFLDAIPVAVVVREPTGGIYFTNQKAKDLLGIEADAPGLGRPPRLRHQLHRVPNGEPYPEDQLPAARALLGEKTHLNDMELRKDGTTLSLEAWGAPILGDNGQVKFGLSAMIDVTAQKEITESLRQREEFFRNLFEEGPIGMILSLEDGSIVNANRAFSDMLGIPKPGILGRSFHEFTPPEDGEVEKGLDRKLFGKLLPKYQLEKRYLDSKGRALWCKVSASVIRDVEDRPVFRLAIIENVTEQKEAEAAARESVERFRTLAESANDAIISANSAGRILFFNRSAERIFGYKVDEVQGRPIAVLMSDASWRENQELIRRYLISGEPTLPGRILELTGQRKDGSSFPAEISYFSWRTQAGLFFTCILRDITERKQLEEMKDDLISVVSHQLKTPVAQINGYIENLLEGLAGGLNQRQMEYLSDMRNIGSENYRLISDLLSLSKIERGVLRAELGSESMRDIIELTTRDYSELIQEKGLGFTVTGPAEDFRVFVDKDKTVETLRNVLNNALKCTDHGSIDIAWRRNESYAEVEIRDTGIGMDEKTRGTLFTKTRVMGLEAGRSGAGLGLFIAKNFMDLQGATISVDSEAGKGSTFKVKLPLDRPSKGGEKG